MEPRFHRLTTRRERGLKKEREAGENFSHRGQNLLILLKKTIKLREIRFAVDFDGCAPELSRGVAAVPVVRLCAVRGGV